jgi:hypothetical protein
MESNQMMVWDKKISISQMGYFESNNHKYMIN